MDGGRPVRVLLAEANASESDLISACLDMPEEDEFASDVDLDLQCVTTLEAAIRAVERDRFDVLLLDLNLADCLGLDTYYRIRAHLNGVAVVILTTYEDSSSASQAIQAGAHDLVVKHRIDRQTLRRAVRYAIERNKRQLAELELASAGFIQERILSSQRPTISGLDLAANCEPACTVGGDFYDFVRLLDGRLAMLLGDVSGHGLGPAMLSAEARGIFRTVSEQETDPGSLLTEINRLIAKDCVNGAFITMFLAVICPETWTLRFGTAGHEGYLLSEQHVPKQRLTGRSPPIGVLPDHQFHTADVVGIGQNESVFACTDGLTECYCPYRNSFFGMEGVFSSLKKAQGPATEMIGSLFSSVRQFHQASHDDMTAVIARTVVN